MALLALLWDKNHHSEVACGPMSGRRTFIKTTVKGKKAILLVYLFHKISCFLMIFLIKEKYYAPHLTWASFFTKGVSSHSYVSLFPQVCPMPSIVLFFV